MTIPENVSDTAEVTPSEDTLRALVGHRFPGGTYRIAHWENFLFTDATATSALGDGLAHPASLFHVAINGAGTSIEELFELAHARVGGPISIAYYDWQLHQPLHEEQTYSVSGGIADVARSVRRNGRVRDGFTYKIEIEDSSAAPVADVEFCWYFWRELEGSSS